MLLVYSESHSVLFAGSIINSQIGHTLQTSMNRNSPQNTNSSTWTPPDFSPESDLSASKRNSFGMPVSERHSTAPLSSPKPSKPTNIPPFTVNQHHQIPVKSRSLFSDLDPFSTTISSKPTLSGLPSKISPASAPPTQKSSEEFAIDRLKQISSQPLQNFSHAASHLPSQNAVPQPTTQPPLSLLHDLSFFETLHQTPPQKAAVQSQETILGADDIFSISVVPGADPFGDTPPFSASEAAPAPAPVPKLTKAPISVPTAISVPVSGMVPSHSASAPTSVLAPSPTPVPMAPTPVPVQAPVQSSGNVVPRPPSHTQQAQFPKADAAPKLVPLMKDSHGSQRRPELKVDCGRSFSRSVSEVSGSLLQHVGYPDSLTADFAPWIGGGGSPHVRPEEAELPPATPRLAKDQYRPRSRGPVNMERPVAIEVRPKPLKLDSEAANRGRAMVCTASCIYTASDYEIRAWNVDHAMAAGHDGSKNFQEDREAAATELILVRGARAQCLAVSEVDGMMWTGHADGGVRCWRIRWEGGQLDTGPGSVLEWKAHKHPVSAMVITSYGELWTGSETGEMKAWPCQPLSAALESQSATAVQKLQTSCVDLTGKVGQGPGVVLGNVHSDVRFLVAQRSHGRVWSGGRHSIVVWDARTHEMLKSVGPQPHNEFSANRGATPSQAFKEVKEKISPASSAAFLVPEGDEKSSNKFWKSLQSAVGGAGRAVEAAVGVVGGAADKVRRAAHRVESAKRVGAMAAAENGTVWAGFESGLLLQWNCLGGIEQEQQPCNVAVRSLCCVGARLWVAYADRKIVVLNGSSGRRVGQWEAHKHSSVSHLAMCGNYVVSLASHGGIRAWSMNSPGPSDALLRNAMAAQAQQYTVIKHLRVGAATWNVGEERPGKEALLTWLERMADRDIIAVGLQEMEVGAGTIAMAAAKETVGLESGSNGALWWLSNIHSVIGESFKRVGWKQLAGMLIGVWVRKVHESHVTDFGSGAVPCGFGRALGNKGAVGIQLSIFHRTFCFLNSHLAAHQENVARRNQDWMRIYHRMAFGDTMGAVGMAASSVAKVAANAIDGFVKVAQTSQYRKNFNRMTSAEVSSDVDDVEPDAPPAEETFAGDGRTVALSEADFLVWMGDFNYRLNATSAEHVLDAIESRQLELLLEKDQLRQQQAEGSTLLGMKEADIRFQPTYKFERRRQGAMAYDASEKRRIPAWCDRVLYRDSFEEDSSREDPSLYKPLRATVVSYGSSMDVLDSDHKPVHCLLDVRVATVDQSQRRKLLGELQSSDEALRRVNEKSIMSVPGTVLHPKFALLDGAQPTILTLKNSSRDAEAIFSIMVDYGCREGMWSCGHDSHLSAPAGRLAGGFPPWLQVLPACGILSPRESASIKVKFMEPSKTGGMESGEQVEKVVVLVIEVRGSLCKESYKTRICVHHGHATSRLLRLKPAR